jgi:DNA-binding LacI/PurR family transcriptional regulator/mannose-6-phosphate isomerase-like protein (cupin superfamily)
MKPDHAQKATAADVASRAGVSRSAVSRYFTPGASVSPRTAQKVARAAAELGYRPNILARSLMTGHSRIIGLVVAYLDNYFYPEVLERLSTALQKRGYHVLVFMAPSTRANVDQVISEILDYQVDGIIMASVTLSSELTYRCQAVGVPVVLFNRLQDTDGISAVTSDNFAGGRLVADFLVAGGHRRMAYIAGSESASTQRDREAGFRAGLSAAGLDLVTRGVGDYDRETTARVCREIFGAEARERPDAVFVANDHMAIVVMDVLRHELGLAVPGDVSVVGYDDVPPASWLSYDLTTVRQPADLMVAETIEILLGHVADPTMPPRRVATEARLVVRGSARRPADRPAGQDGNPRGAKPGMEETPMLTKTPLDLTDRIVRYGELQPCRTAFIDAHTPGSDRKENFTIIGGGVSEAADQHVHITIPHGFNIGAAGQPPNCRNSLHSHRTAEVFFVLSGRWRFFWGRWGTAGEVVLEEGDIFNIPTGIFRGFENIGTDYGMIMAILGGDDAGGGVIWAPQVIEDAAGHGLILGENGKLYDSKKGQGLPEGMGPMPVLTEAELAAFPEPAAAEVVPRHVARYRDLVALADPQPARVIGEHGVLRDRPGFEVALVTRASATDTPHAFDRPSVLMPVKGHWRVTWEGGSAVLAPGDTMSVPETLAHTAVPSMSGEAALYHVVATDDPPGATWTG